MPSSEDDSDSSYSCSSHSEGIANGDLEEEPPNEVELAWLAEELEESIRGGSPGRWQAQPRCEFGEVPPFGSVVLDPAEPSVFPEIILTKVEQPNADPIKIFSWSEQNIPHKYRMPWIARKHSIVEVNACRDEIARLKNELEAKNNALSEREDEVKTLQSQKAPDHCCDGQPGHSQKASTDSGELSSEVSTRVLQVRTSVTESLSSLAAAAEPLLADLAQKAYLSLPGINFEEFAADHLESLQLTSNPWWSEWLCAPKPSGERGSGSGSGSRPSSPRP